MSFFQFSKKNPKFFLQRRRSFFSAHSLCPLPSVFNSNHCHQKSTSSMFSSGHFHQIFLSTFVVPLSTIVMHHNSSLQFLRSHLILCYQRPVFLFLFQLSCCFQPLLMKIACSAQLKITICQKQPLLSTSAFFFLPAYFSTSLFCSNLSSPSCAVGHYLRQRFSFSIACVFVRLGVYIFSSKLIKLGFNIIFLGF